MSDKMKEVNEKLKASIVGTDSLDEFVEAFYDSFEELRDGFQATDLLSLFTSFLEAFNAKKMAFAEAMDLQDDEITRLLDKDAEFNLGDTRNEARQVLKQVLVSLQSYDILFYEKRAV